MTPKEAYTEALRRIREAETTRAVGLDLSGLETLNRLPRELEGLSWLQSLDLSNCHRLKGDLSPLAGLAALQSLELSHCHLSGDLSPLAGLTSLQSLNLSWCGELYGDLSPLAGLTSLQWLDLFGCGPRPRPDLSALAGLASLKTLRLHLGKRSNLSPLAGLPSLQELCLAGEIRKFAPLEPLLAQLRDLRLSECEFDDLPSEICGKELTQNVIREVRAHFADLKSGQSLDAELKLFILGNGGVGKTQLSRRLQHLEFDPEIPTTHGIELNFVTTDVHLKSFKGSVRNLWDFGGQEIYHGSHTLFLHGQAVFLLLWNPEEEKTAGKKTGSEHRPISFWLDYLRAVAGSHNPLIIVQSQCDKPEIRADVPVRLSDWIGSF